MKVKFLSYTKTPEEKNQLGIARVILESDEGDVKIILKYKKVQKKDGLGFFFSSPSVKAGEWEEGFEIDSRETYRVIEAVIRAGLDKPEQSQITSINEVVDEEGMPF